MDSPYKGRLVVVTGAVGDIGTALVKAVVSEGAEVIGFDTNARKFGELERACSDLPGALRLIPLDLAGSTSRYPESDVASIVADGSLHTLFCLAGGDTSSGKPSNGFTNRISLRENIEANLYTANNAILGCLAGLQKGRGTVITTSSVNAVFQLGQPTYAASKAALETLTQEWAINQTGVTFICTRLGTYPTGRWPGRFEANPEVKSYLELLHPLGEIPSVDELVHAYLTFGDGQWRLLNGQIVTLSGGQFQDAGTLPARRLGRKWFEPPQF